MAGFFPLFFKEYWSANLSASESTYLLGMGNSAAGLLSAVLAPFLGAIADLGFGKKKFLGIFTTIGIGFTVLLYFVPQGASHNAIIIYAIASFAYVASTNFYDALLVDVAPPERMDMVSSLGYSLGYIGGGLLFLFNVLMYLYPEKFGLSNGAEAIKLAFVSVGLWWLIFSLPLFTWTKEIFLPPTQVTMWQASRSGWSMLRKTWQELRMNRNLVLFILAYLFYIDGVNTIIKMAVDYGMALGFSAQNLIVALLLVQFIGFPSALGFGYLAQYLSRKRAIYLCLWTYGLITVMAFFMTASWQFYVLAGAIGLVQGGIQALSRSFFAQMIPPEKAGEYFGFFNLIGKFSAVLGPALMGLMSLWTQSPRHSILVLLVLFVSGGVILYQVPAEPKIHS